MAKNKSVVYLGFEDELITDKNKSLVDYTVAKVGGLPDWPHSDIKISGCPICGLNRPLILQIYAPLENSQFHRTLYIFGCLNAICSNQSQSWFCVRVQVIEKRVEIESTNVNARQKIESNISWCSGADDWDETDTLNEENNFTEENGNIINYENIKLSDEDDESNSMDSDPLPGFENLNVDDKNANCEGGAVGRLINSPSATAEIDLNCEDSEVITIDTPILPQSDLIELLKQSQTLSKNIGNIILKGFFIAVDEEKYNAPSVSEHVRDLLQEYQMKDDNIRPSPDSPGNIAGGACGGVGVGFPDSNLEQEKYEKGTPIHGDAMFHRFLTKINENPGQIIRYSRDSSPLLISPIKEQNLKCCNCGGELICELQILPTIISKLRLENNDSVPMEFGNVLIFTCLKSCWDTPDKMRLEHVIVQQEY